MSYCHSCGYQLPDNANFCQHCGVPVIIEDPVESTQPVKTIQTQNPVTIEQSKIVYDRSNSFYFWKAQQYKLIVFIYISILSAFCVMLPFAFVNTNNLLFVGMAGLAVVINVIVSIESIIASMSYIYFISVSKYQELKWYTVITEALMYFAFWIIAITLIIYLTSISNWFLLTNAVVATFVCFAYWFDIPFGKGFHHHYEITPKNIFAKNWFKPSFIIFAVLDLILIGIIYPTYKELNTPIAQQPITSPTPLATKAPTKQPTKVPTVTQIFAPTMHGIKCKHFTQITDADIYQNICVYGRTDRAYSPSFSWINLQSGYRTIQLTSNVWVYNEYVPVGTCVVAYGRPQNNDRFITFIIHSETDNSNIYDEPNANELCDK